MIDPQVAARRAELPFAVRTLKAQRDTTPRMTATAWRSSSPRRACHRRQEGQRVGASSRRRRPGSTRRLRMLACWPPETVAACPPAPSRRGSRRRSGGLRRQPRSARCLRDVEQAHAKPLEYSSRRVVARTPRKEAPADRIFRALGSYDEARRRAHPRGGAGRRRDGPARPRRKGRKGQPDRQAPGFVGRAGRPLTTEQIAAERRATPAWSRARLRLARPEPHRPGSFYRESSRPVKVEDRAFTGEAQRKGTLDVSAEALHANAASCRRSPVRARGVDPATSPRRAAPRRRRDRHGTRAEVEKAIGETQFDAKGNPIHGAYQWRVIRP